MEAAFNCQPKRLYSWWWDSHISPKNSKWLHDNLNDMDNKIKAMIKLIEEDADSFARRAEMYYKKRPDLMKLVEEFYRAYRALAERYDHLTGALRQAHRTIGEAFPNEMQLMLPDEPPSGLHDTVEDTSECGMPTQSNAIPWDGESLDEIAPFFIKEGLKHLNWLFADEEAKKKFGERLLKKSLSFNEDEGKYLQCRRLEADVLKLSKENKNLNDQVTLESMRADRAEAELQTLKNASSKLKSELEAAFLQYQVSQERISNLESEISESKVELQHLNDEISIKVSKLNITEQGCVSLKRENASLQLELEKLNRAVTVQEKEASGLLEENRNLHKRANSESKRAGQAEAESIRLRDAISKLKSEMESAFIQYNISQVRISDLEAEISSSKEWFKNINDEMSIGASKLNMAEEQCLLLQMENKSLQHELEKFKQRVMRQEEEMTMREEECYKLKQFLEDECQRSMHTETREKSLQLQLNKLEQAVKKQEEELALREKQLDKLKQQIEDERKQCLFTERIHQSLVDCNSQSEEKMRLLNLEFQSETDKLRRMELRNSGLEEEIRHLRSENSVLNERNFSSVSKLVSLKDEIIFLRISQRKLQDELRVHAEEKMFLQQELSSFKSKKNDLEEGLCEITERLRRKELREAGLEEEMRHLHDESIGFKEKSFSKIVNLQDEIISLTESKYRLEDELQSHTEEKKILQQELYSLKNDRHDLEERRLELMEQIEEVNFNVVSLQALVRELHDGNNELKDICKNHEDEKIFHLEQLRLMDIIIGNNAILNNSLSGADAELKCLLEKLRELNTHCESLHGNVFNHMSLKPEMCSYVEAATHNMEKLSERNALLGKNIFDLDFEFEVLRGKLKALEERCQSFYHQKSYLIAENTNLISQVERFSLHLQNLENCFLIIEGKHVNIEKDRAIHRTEELCGPVTLGKEQHKDHICYFRRQTGILGNQIHHLKEENKVIKAKLEEEQYKTIESEIHSVIMEQFINDLIEKNMLLSKKCGKYMEKFHFAEKFILGLKEEWNSQEKKLSMLSDHSEKLLEGIHATMKTYNKKKACETFNIKAACEISNSGNDHTLQLILHKISELRALVSLSKDEVYHFKLEKSVISTLLDQLGLNLMELSERKNLEQESVLISEEVFILESKNNEPMKINEQSQSEITKLLEVNGSLSKSLYELRELNGAFEEENVVILEKCIPQEHLSLIFRSFYAEKSLENEWLIRDVNSLYRITNNLGQEIREINKSMRTLEAENMHLKNEYRTHIMLVEDKVYKDRNAFGKLNLQTEARKKMLEQIDVELSKHQGIETTEMRINQDGCIMEINKANVVREELENNFSLSEDNTRKDCEIRRLHKSNEILHEELHKFHEVVDALKTREKNLTSELQISIENCWSHKQEALKMLDDLHVSSFMELIFKEKFIELMQTLNGLEKTDIMQSKILIEENALRNVQEEDLKEKLDALGRKNKVLKAELNAYVPLIVSLEKEIASLQEQILSLTNLHILNNKRKQGNLLASLQRNKSSKIRGKHHSPKASAGILELKKLRAKVMVLQKAATDTERLLEDGKVVSDTNMDGATRKSKARKAKGSTGLVGAQKKKDIVLDLRKSDASGKGVIVLKDDKFSRGMHEQILKDIELDHVLSTSRCRDGFDVVTAYHNLEMWKPASESNIQYCQIEKIDADRCGYLSAELVLEKNLSVDNLLHPANYTEPLQEWIKRVSCSLSSDVQRLLALKKSAAEMKGDIENFETKCQSSVPELSTVKLQVKKAEGAIMKLNDFIYELTKMAENFSMSSDSHKNRRKVSQRVQRALEKIGGLELKLQKVQHTLSKLQEEQKESKIPKPLERRSRIPLKDLIYGKKSDPRQMKRQFCACMRIKTK